MHYNYILSLNIGIDPRLTCRKYDGIVGIECDVEPWIIDFNGVEVQLPLRIPHASWKLLVECIVGTKRCGRSAEVYKLRRVALALYGELNATTAMKAMYEIYGRAGWSDRAVYAYRYAKFLSQFRRI